MGTVLNAVFQPGFFASAPVHAALLTGAVVAVVSGAVGVFTVLRSQSFAGHALADLGTLGGSGAFLLGLGPLWGFIAAGVTVGGAMDLFGSERRKSRDVSTGIVLGAVLGVSALLLYFDTTQSSTTGATVTILFGSLFAVSGYTVPAMMVMGVTVALGSLIVGTILSPALLIGPAATALRLTRRPVAAMALAASIGVAATWLGILLAYDSYHWPPSGDGWPVSFFVIALIFAGYLGSGIRSRRTKHAAHTAQTSHTADRVPHEAIEVA